MWDPKVHVGTAAIITNHKGKYLLIRRSKNATHGASQWAFPGGWIDFGEQPQDAIVRECKEELGIKVEVTGVDSAVSNIHPAPVDMAVCIFFNCQILPESPTPVNKEPEKTDFLSWVSPQNISGLDLFAPLDTWWNSL